MITKIMNLISFSNRQTEGILINLGIDVSEDIVGKCETCKKDLYLTNIGNIAKGNDGALLYCDNTYCFAEKIAEKFYNSVIMTKKSRGVYFPPVKFSEAKKNRIKSTLGKMPDEHYINPEEELKMKESKNSK